MLQAPDMPLNYNRYTYCMNNPLLYTDPTGNKWYEPWTWSLKRGWDNVWTGLDNFTKWADRTDWFPSSWYVSTDINMHSYKPINRPSEYAYGGTDYIASYNWATSPRRLNSRGHDFDTGSYNINTKPSLRQIGPLLDGMQSIGLSTPELNVGLRDMQMTNLENYGYVPLPTQYVNYESSSVINVPLSHGRSTNLNYGKTVIVIEKTDYFPKGSVVKNEYAMAEGRIKFGFVQETVNRYYINYASDVFAKGLTWFDSFMQPAYGNQNYKSTVIYNGWNEYPYNNIFINQFIDEN